MKAHKKKYFKVFANCIPVKGAKRSIICDLTRACIHVIPNDMYDILTSSEPNIQEIYKYYGIDNKNTIDEYFDFLFLNEYIFLCTKSEMSLFPNISLRWESPSIVTNAIIDFDDKSQYEFKNIFDELEDMQCQDLYIRIFYSAEINFLENILEFLNGNSMKSIVLIVKYNENINYDDYTSLCKKYLKIENLVVFSCPNQCLISKKDNKYASISFTVNNIHNHSHCGIIHPSYFSVNIQTFTESQKHNTCLNRKISIDVNGEIKNCPSMAKSYGNIKDTTLREALEKEGFKDMWYIHKDQIEVCKDCEFRHICTDCRAYIQDPTNIYSKPAKCSYDPYTATWGEENPTNNPLYGK